MDDIKNGLELIVEYFGGIPEGGSVQFWEEMAAKLSRIVGKSPGWGWRYPQGVYTGTLKPSKLFGLAVMALGSAIDEVPTTLIYTVQVRVFAPPGRVGEGSLVMGESKPCKRPGCPVHIVPNVPWREFCSDECRRLDKKQKSPAQ
jgi:hypothetical protein